MFSLRALTNVEFLLTGYVYSLRCSLLAQAARLLLSSLDEESKQRNQAKIITSTLKADARPVFWLACAQQALFNIIKLQYKDYIIDRYIYQCK